MINWIETLIITVLGTFLTYGIIFLATKISKRIGNLIRTKLTKLDDEIFAKAAKKETWRAIFEVNKTAIFILIVIFFGAHFYINQVVGTLKSAIDATYGEQVGIDSLVLTEGWARLFLLVGRVMSVVVFLSMLHFLLRAMWRIYSANHVNSLLSDFNWRLARVKYISNNKFLQEMEVKWAEMKSRSDYREIIKKLDNRLKIQESP